MNPLLEWTISNTAIATGLALVAMLVARFGRTPTLSHVLWLLVLMKLITPPIWKVPVAWTPPGESMTISDVEPVAEFALTGENFSTLDTAELQSATEAFETLPVAQETISASIERSPVPFPIGKLLLSLWAIGSITWFLLAGWRVWKFGKLLKHATPVSTEIQTTIDNIAERMGLRKVPRVVTVEGILPPLLWPFFRRTTIALPAGLLKTLSQNELETLVAHELPGLPNFTGAFVGMACQDLSGARRHADFDHFDYAARAFLPNPCA